MSPRQPTSVTKKSYLRRNANIWQLVHLANSYSCDSDLLLFLTIDFIVTALPHLTQFCLCIVQYKCRIATFFCRPSTQVKTTAPTEDLSGMDEPRKFDSTGMFHWCPDRPLNETLLVSIVLSFSSVQYSQSSWVTKSSYRMLFCTLKKPVTFKEMVMRAIRALDLIIT